jgi:hypothetical protein
VKLQTDAAGTRALKQKNPDRFEQGVPSEWYTPIALQSNLEEIRRTENFE